MPRKKRDSFDDLADFLRTNPVAALRAGRVLRILYGPESVDRASEIVKLVQERDENGMLKLDGPDIVGPLLEDAASHALAPKRKAGRPRKERATVDLPGALRNAAGRRRIDEVADAIVSKGLLESGAEEAMERAAGRFSAKRSRPVARAAMKRSRARLLEVETDRRKRTPDDRPRLLAARVVLEAHGYPSEPDDARKLLRWLQRGSAASEARLADGLGIARRKEEAGAGLLAKLDKATPKRAR